MQFIQYTKMRKYFAVIIIIIHSQVLAQNDKIAGYTAHFPLKVQQDSSLLEETIASVSESFSIHPNLIYHHIQYLNRFHEYGDDDSTNILFVQFKRFKSIYALQKWEWTLEQLAQLKDRLDLGRGRELIIELLTEHKQSKPIKFAPPYPLSREERIEENYYACLFLSQRFEQKFQPSIDYEQKKKDLLQSVTDSVCKEIMGTEKSQILDAKDWIYSLFDDWYLFESDKVLNIDGQNFELIQQIEDILFNKEDMPKLLAKNERGYYSLNLKDISVAAGGLYITPYRNSDLIFRLKHTEENKFTLDKELSGTPMLSGIGIKLESKLWFSKYPVRFAYINVSLALLKLETNEQIAFENNLWELSGPSRYERITSTVNFAQIQEISGVDFNLVTPILISPNKSVTITAGIGYLYTSFHFDHSISYYWYLRQAHYEFTDNGAIKIWETQRWDSDLKQIERVSEHRLLYPIIGASIKLPIRGVEISVRLSTSLISISTEYVIWK